MSSMIVPPLRSGRSCFSCSIASRISPLCLRYNEIAKQRRYLQRDASAQSASANSASPSFAFAFDIDGVLCRSNTALPGAQNALKLLRKNSIPFILLTNGGGKTERARTEELSKILDVDISESVFVQSHTPFASFTDPTHSVAGRDATVLVMGGPKDGHSCRLVAEGYGFGSVVTPLDIYAAHPEIWPFGPHPSTIRMEHVRGLPKPLAPSTDTEQELEQSGFLKIDAVMVFNDPREWSVDISILLDTLLSKQGYLGTWSQKLGKDDLPNRGYLQDGQPRVYFSNPDVFWAAEWPLPRLGQGAFRAAFEGVWKAATNGAELTNLEQWGKPHAPTYNFAEERLAALAGLRSPQKAFRTVYMVGDNPESDILGANSFKSSYNTEWCSILVRSGVYPGGKPAHEPKMIVDGVYDAVQEAFKEQSFQDA